MLSSVSNEPAGRLRNVLRVVQQVGPGRTLSGIWESAAADIVPARGDALSARAEAGALYSSVETAINALPAEHDREAFRAYRHTWAKPIFGVGLADSPSQQLGGANIVSAEALHTLSMLSSTLRSEAPEPMPRLEQAELWRGLDSIYETLGQLHIDVSTTSWFDRRARSRLLILITEAMDNIVFINFRGFGSLERAALVVEGELIGSAGQLSSPGGIPEELRVPWLECVQSWLADVRPIVRHIREMVEYDVAPLAGGVAVGLTTGDVTAALAIWIGGRVALEGRRPAPPVDETDRRRMLPTGEQPAEEPADSIEASPIVEEDAP